MWRDKKNIPEGLGLLSGAECRIAEGYVCGFIGKEIAEKTNLSYNTVVRHTQNIYDKTGIKRSTNSLVAWFISQKYNIDLSEITQKFGAVVLVLALGIQVITTDYKDAFLRSRATKVEVRNIRVRRGKKTRRDTFQLETTTTI